jgi:hypothetical protein
LSHTFDANVLLYSSDRRSPLQPAAAEFVRRCAAGSDLLYLFWPVLMAYLRISTHPRIFDDPLSPDEARGNVEALLGLPHVRAPGEGDDFWRAFRSATDGLVVRGDLVPDAHVVALMRQYGVSTIWTRDRDFAKFHGIQVRDPFE